MSNDVYIKYWLPWILIPIFVFSLFIISNYYHSKKRQHYIDLIMKKHHTLDEVREILDYELKYRQSKSQIKVFANINLPDHPQDTIEEIIREKRWCPYVFEEE